MHQYTVRHLSPPLSISVIRQGIQYNIRYAGILPRPEAMAELPIRREEKR